MVMHLTADALIFKTDINFSSDMLPSKIALKLCKIRMANLHSGKLKIALGTFCLSYLETEFL